MTTATVVRRRPATTGQHPAAPAVATDGTSAPTALTPAGGHSNVEAPPIENARQALSAARLMRSEYLIALVEGLVTVDDVIEAALADSGKPLRRISLRQLLLSQPGWGERRTSRVLSVLADRLGTAERPKDMTVAWLIDPRSGGRRYLAWLDVQQAKNSVPWAGFPFAPRKGDDR